ncbi:IS30 family transposase [Motilibacter rhizosphaerae]|uniref:IS30 family transposase n=1 Tax=Motilibacter rhizosphaerae TaxID=598652 RepID=UPI0038B3B269
MAERLSFDERVAISELVKRRLSFRAIGAILGRAHTTVAREVNADRDRAGAYHPRRANGGARERARRPKVLRLEADDELRAEVSHWLRAGASPMQACGRVAPEHPGQSRWKVSHSTVYNAIYVLGRARINVELDVALRTGRLRRMSRAATRAAGDTPRFLGMVGIADRPDEVAGRAVPGHWEGDLVEGNRASRSAIITLVERQSRYLITSLLPHGKTSEQVITAIQARMRSLPADLRRTLTWDQGSEMARHLDLALDPQIEVYFCDPHSPWQRPTNENTNGLIREYFPKGTDFTKVSAEDLQAATDRLNGRPRKVLDFRTPAKAFAELVTAAGATTA